MKNALFTNWTTEQFTGYWDGKPKVFTPGKSLYMPDYLAKHFAKHLTNRELLRRDENGNAIYKDGEKMTSPKRPEDVPLYMELFNKAYTHDEQEQEELGSVKDDINTLIESANRNKDEKKSNKSQEAQIIDVPEDDEDEESSFQGKPVDNEISSELPTKDN